MSLNCNLDLMCGSSDGLGDFIFLLPFWGSNLNAYYKNYVPARIVTGKQIGRAHV